MLKTPKRYLESILSKNGLKKDLSIITLHLVLKSSKSIHFIVDEKEIDVKEIICNLSQQKCGSISYEFDFKLGQKVYSYDYESIYQIKSITPILTLCNSAIKITPQNLDRYLPISNYEINSIGVIQNRIEEFKKSFGAQNQHDFFNNEKLLVIANQNIFKLLPKEYPACFVKENELEQIEIKYNSPLLPKISILKNINLLERYLENEINGKQVTFSTCIFVGGSKYAHSISTIRNYYNQKKITRVIFIGEKDSKLDLGNNQVPLRWKWTIPEIKYLKGEEVIEPGRIIVRNKELDESISDFYKLLYDIEIKHTVKLRSLFRHIRRLYYDLSLKMDSFNNKINQISNDFETSLNEALSDGFWGINPDFDYQEYQAKFKLQFNKILNAIRKNNKTEWLKDYNTFIHQLISPPFLHSTLSNELNQIYRHIQKRVPTIKLLEDIDKSSIIRNEYWDNKEREYFSLAFQRAKTDIKSFAKSDDDNEMLHKVVASIYGNGRIDKFIERLAKAKTKYNLLVYEIEEKAFNYHIDKYIEEINREYASPDRYEISGVEFNDPYYQFSTFDNLIEALAETMDESNETEYRIVFTDNLTVKLPSTKNVLKILEEDKHKVSIEELEPGDSVQIYVNPDKKTLRAIFELKHPEMIKKADEYSQLWQNCLLEYYSKISEEDECYERLVRNRFTVSKNTLRRYLNKEVTFPRGRRDLIAIAKTINDNRFSFELVRNDILPFISDYRGKEIEYGFKLSESINSYLISGEMDEFISEWYAKNDIEKIVSQIPVKTIKDIELLTKKSENDE
ncbi:MAG: hypothetical protein KJ893_10960 [Candidatus Omnitrophica bacterium]|nr:hypothetical protein [Candidatus Omnitrophota bacterium]MBU4479739.1 hypothetical protein [Candidatus Omnitrophota bacterium]